MTTNKMYLYEDNSCANGVSVLLWTCEDEIKTLNGMPYTQVLTSGMVKVNCNGVINPNNFKEISGDPDTISALLANHPEKYLSESNFPALVKRFVDTVDEKIHYFVWCDLLKTLKADGKTFGYDTSWIDELLKIHNTEEFFTEYLNECWIQSK